MAEGGFDDFEINKMNEEKEEMREGETNFGGDDLESHNRSINIINTENPKSKFNRVDNIPDIKKDTGSMRRSMTSDRKKSFKKIFKVNLEKKNVPNSSILLDETVFLIEKENISIVFKGKKIGNVNDNLEPELFSRKNKKYVDEFNDYMKKAIKEYEKTPASLVNQLVEQQLFKPYEPEVVEDMIENSRKKINEQVEEEISQLNQNFSIKSNDLREFAGVLNPKGRNVEDKIDFVEAQADHWRLLALREIEDPRCKRRYGCMLF